MNYAKANVVGNDKNIFIPVQSGQRVYLATKDEVNEALGLSNIKNPLVCGYIEMYENSGEDNKITLPVNIDSKFLIGPEGAHLNISGISGLAAKTSYAMFLLKAIQDKYLNGNEDEVENESVAFIVFNVKGRDLLAIDEPNDFDDNPEKAEEIKLKYEMLGLSTKPFRQVKYFYPYSTKTKSNSYVPKELFDKQKQQQKAFQYKFTYEQDKDTIDLMFSNVEDSTQTMESIVNQIIDGQNGFNMISTWPSFIKKLEEQCESGNTANSKIKKLE